MLPPDGGSRELGVGRQPSFKVVISTFFLKNRQSVTGCWTGPLRVRCPSTNYLHLLHIDDFAVLATTSLQAKSELPGMKAAISVWEILHPTSPRALSLSASLTALLPGADQLARHFESWPTFLRHVIREKPCVTGREPRAKGGKREDAFLSIVTQFLPPTTRSGPVFGRSGAAVSERCGWPRKQYLVRSNPTGPLGGSP